MGSARFRTRAAVCFLWLCCSLETELLTKQRVSRPEDQGTRGRYVTQTPTRSRTCRDKGPFSQADSYSSSENPQLLPLSNQFQMCSNHSKVLFDTVIFRCNCSSGTQSQRLKPHPVSPPAVPDQNETKASHSSLYFNPFSPQHQRVSGD